MSYLGTFSTREKYEKLLDVQADADALARSVETLVGAAAGTAVRESVYRAFDGTTGKLTLRTD